MFHALMAAQAVGAAIILWQGMPIYHYLHSKASDLPAPLSTRLWALAGIAIIQAAYWTAWRWFPAVKLPRQVFFGHVLQFAARLNFVFVAGVFSAAYIVRPEGLEFRPWGFLLMMSAMFSMFCFTQALDRLGSAFVGGSADRSDSVGSGASRGRLRAGGLVGRK